MKRFCFYWFLFFGVVCEVMAQITPLISSGSSWKYLDNGTNQGTAWRTISFNDAAWSSGNAELGYGDGDEATVVSYGPSSSNKYITTYFRKQFNVANPSQFFSINLQAKRDDGIVVYVNGTEVWRDNMPGGNITYTTPASSAIAFGAESAWNTNSFSPLNLVSGNNIIAVEIHQESGSSSDITFDLKLDGNATVPAITIQRGPYLQLGTPTSMILKWKTDVNCDSKVFYGTSVSSLTNQVSDVGFSTNHEIKITGLNSSTTYYYTIGTSSGTLMPASLNQFFKTSPLTGTKNKYKFWVVGDVGTGDANQAASKTGFLNYTANSHIDGWIWLGDNAYEGGYDSEYQTGIFAASAFAAELKRIVVWPSPGNHDYNNNIPFSPPPAYLDIFSLPSNGEAGGIPSGTEKYYSYNYGNIHFVVLDSYSVPRGSTDVMATWLQNDLAANTLPWTIAYWHHPPYTKGSHNSDNPNFLDGELPEIRQNIIPILESNGVDLVLNGHSHSYERSFLIDGHYGTSSQLSPSMIKDNTSGYYPASCPYQKHTVINKANKGTIYCVVGCSGKTGGTSSGWPHPIMYSYTNTILGSMLLEINDNRLDAKFITSANSVYDGFSIVQNAGKKTSYNICQGQSISLKPSWPATVQWFPQGTTQDSVVVNPLFSTTYYAYDASSCIEDTFVVNVVPSGFPPCNVTSVQDLINQAAVSVYPTFINRSETIFVKSFPGENISEIKVYDITGKETEVKVLFENEHEVSLLISEDIKPGIYLLSFRLNNQLITKKIIFNK